MFIIMMMTTVMTISNSLPGVSVDITVTHTNTEVRVNTEEVEHIKDVDTQYFIFMKIYSQNCL